jgi:hypothetical protein
MMRRDPEWKTIAKKAWSFRFMVLAGLLTTAEVLLPLYTDILPRGLFAILTLVAVTGGLIARIVVQKDLP